MKVSEDEQTLYIAREMYIFVYALKHNKLEEVKVLKADTTPD